MRAPLGAVLAALFPPARTIVVPEGCEVTIEVSASGETGVRR